MGNSVRFAGRITQWNDDKGFGFVAPNGGGDRAFVHVSEFERGSRRPVTGDLISYLAAKDDRGRLQAKDISFAGASKANRQQRARFPRAKIGASALASVIVSTAFGWLPPMVAAMYLAASSFSYLSYLLDKRAAGTSASRTPEKHLHLIDLLGGWPGGLIAQQQFRHKTAKQSFQIVFWTTVLLNLVGVVWLINSGTAAEWSRTLLS